MKNKTINALLEMGMPANIKGFQYIVDAMLLFENEEWRTGKMTALYHEIGKKNGTTASRVERAIRYAFCTVLTKGDKKFAEKYLMLQYPANGNLLHIFYLRLAQEE